MRIYQRGRNADGTRSTKAKDITAICTGVTMEGSVKSASRVLTFEVLREKEDYFLGGIANIARGDAIGLKNSVDDADWAYYGIVWRIEENDSEPLKKIVCYDKIKFLATSDCLTCVFNDMTAAEITKKVCGELGVTLGKMPVSTEKVNVNARGKSGYEAIMIAWTELHKITGKYYYPRMVGGIMQVIEKGEKLPAALTLGYQSQPSGCNLTQIKKSESSDDAITALWKRDDAGAYSFDKSDKKLAHLLGYIVGVNDDGQSADQNKLKKINAGKTVVTANAIGDWRVQTGWSISVESEILREKVLYIESDRHVYENGIHTMELELSYENSMDEHESVKEADADINDDDGLFVDYTIEEKAWNFLRANGFGAVATAATMGFMWGESGFDPTIVENDGILNGVGYGICQWSYGRRTNLQNWCKQNGHDYTSIEGQLAYFLYEFTTYDTTWIQYARTGCSGSVVCGGYHAGVGGIEGYKKLNDLATAVHAITWWFGRPNAAYARISERLNRAQHYYSMWKNYEKIPGKKVTTKQGNGICTGRFGWPFANGAGTVTQGFSGVYGHRGWDISTRAGYGAGSPVLAVDGGVVAGAGWQLDDWSYGNAVTIKHRDGLCTRYAHLSSVSVRKGQKVSKGQQIGIEGNTGNSNGTHLHFEILAWLPWGTLYDPGNYLNRQG